MLMVSSPQTRIRPPPVDDVNKLRHDWRCQCCVAPRIIHIRRNVLFTSPEYAVVALRSPRARQTRESSANSRHGDYIYLGNTNGVVRCFASKTGKKIYEERLSTDASIYASLVAADGKIFCTSEDGDVYVLKAGPEFQIISRNRMGAPCYATPALSEGILYFRTTESLIAVG